MEQNEKTKGTKKVIGQISNGFYSEIGALLAKISAKVLFVIIVAVVTFFASYFGGKKGGKKASEPIIEEIVKRDSIYSETLARWDTISYKVNNKMDFDKAKKYELDGFHSLIDKKYGEAIWNFMMSENSANGYHASYDIAQYLRNHENSLSKPNFWNNTYKYVVDTYWGYIPSDVLTEMKKSINSQN